MEIIKQAEGDKIVITLKGRLDTMTAPDLQAPLLTALTEYNEVVLDFTEIAYVSSAGLRVLMLGQKSATTNKKKMSLKGVAPEIMEVFEMTGFTDILTFI